ncbi:MAG: thiol:disulfide interchange protein DsbA/DsbL [Methylosarcina sp.]
MLKKITRAGLLVLFFFCSFWVQAEEPRYETLMPAQPTHNPDKIEVIEFFSYGCPHCYTFEPLLEAWIKKLPENVEFIRQPVLFQTNWDQYAKAYFIAEVLGVVEKVHADFFDALHVKNQKLASEEELTKFFVDHGVKEGDFRDAFNSFLVDTKVRQAPAMLSRYGVSGVPTLVVNGKYKINSTLAGSQEGMLEVASQLIKQEGLAK